MLFLPSARGGAVVEAVDGSVGAEAKIAEPADPLVRGCTAVIIKQWRGICS